MDKTDSTNKLLQPAPDGLPMRESGIWSKTKLDVLGYYIAISTVAMKDRPWRRRFYIDLQAGPGKNRIEGTQETLLGSPLLALTKGALYTDYRLVEKHLPTAEALWQRIQATGLVSKENIINANCNEAVDIIVNEINQIDSQYIPGLWSSLSFAFFDPEGLELEWETVAKLATLRRVDLMINFSTGGVRRAWTQALDLPIGASILDKFCGPVAWRDIPLEPDGSIPIRAVLDSYKKQLEDIGFKWGEEISVPIKTTYGVELYRLLFASKSEVGIDFWEKARKGGPQQLSLF